MFGRLSGIKLKGGYFEEYNSFKLFQDSKYKVALVYGKNGSGKSSISKGVE